MSPTFHLIINSPCGVVVSHHGSARDLNSAAALSDKPNVEIYNYPGCNHAFARHTGAHYNAAAAAKANGRTWQFLADHLS